jgi:hypothetical protein
MDFESKYPLTQDQNSFIFAEWTKGYRLVNLTYKNRLICSFENGLRYIKKDLIVSDEELGEVKIRFTEKPIQMDIVIDGLHSPINQKHPAKSFKRTAIFYWVLAGLFALPFVFALLAMIATFSFNVNRLPSLFFTASILVLSVVVSVIAHYINKGNVLAFYLGISFVGTLPFYLRSSDIMFCFYIPCLIYLLLRIPNAKRYAKHKAYKTFQSDILD